MNSFKGNIQAGLTQTIRDRFAIRAIVSVGEGGSIFRPALRFSAQEHGSVVFHGNGPLRGESRLSAIRVCVTPEIDRTLSAGLFNEHLRLE